VAENLVELIEDILLMIDQMKFLHCSHCEVLSRAIKGTKLNLLMKSQKLMAAKYKGFTVLLYL